MLERAFTPLGRPLALQTTGCQTPQAKALGPGLSTERAAGANLKMWAIFRVKSQIKSTEVFVKHCVNAHSVTAHVFVKSWMRRSSMHHHSSFSLADCSFLKNRHTVMALQCFCWKKIKNPSYRYQSISFSLFRQGKNLFIFIKLFHGPSTRPKSGQLAHFLQSQLQ